MSCNSFSIGDPTPPDHPNNQVFLGDTVETRVTNPDPEAITVGARLYVRKAVAGASEDLVGSKAKSIGGGPTTVPVVITWNDQVNYLDGQPFNFIAKVKCSNNRELTRTNPRVFIVEI